VKLYEGMFLVDHNKARQEFDKIREEITGLVEKAGGEMVNLEPWTERKLCYEIKRHRRGAFIMGHFNSPPDGIAKIERGCRLSEIVLRTLIVRDEDGTAIPHYSERGEFDERRDSAPGRKRFERRTAPAVTPAAAPVVTPAAAPVAVPSEAPEVEKGEVKADAEPEPPAKPPAESSVPQES